MVRPSGWLANDPRFRGPGLESQSGSSLFLPSCNTWYIIIVWKVWTEDKMHKLTEKQTDVLSLPTKTGHSVTNGTIGNKKVFAPSNCSVKTFHFRRLSQLYVLLQEVLLQSLKLYTFPFFRAFKVRSQIVHFALTFRSAMTYRSVPLHSFHLELQSERIGL